MTNVIVLNTKNKMDIELLAKTLQQESVQANIVVAQSELQQIEFENVEQFCFDIKDDEDEILNTLLAKVDGDVCVVRNANATFDDVVAVAKNITKNNDVVVCKKQRNKVAQFLFNAINFVVAFMFGFLLFDANLGVVGFGSLCSDIIKETKNASMWTKVSKLKGTDKKEIDVQTQKVKFGSAKKQQIARPIVYVFLAILCFVLLTCVSAIKNNMFLMFVCLFFALLFVILFIVSCLKLWVFFQVGKNTTKMAKIRSFYGKN